MQKTVLIVGASRGLGLGLAKQFSSEGWQVIATVRNSQQADALSQIPQVSVETLEMTDATSIEVLVERLEGARLDVLFVNAGVAGPQNKPATQASEAEVGQLFFTNAVAPLRLAEHLLPRVDDKQGVVVFMSSILGSVETGPGMGMSLYGASKAALNHMTRTFVAELGETGLTVLSMHPGWVKTDMGGEQAPLDVETSARGMVEQVTKALGSGGHRYLDYQGTPLPW
ncbi:MAG: SDR family oxidoreductase [Gammaproteobacteria bacterium]|uniref:SDR family oxidoreductase n=1 Tax=Stutzerimonas xanthomarina TaxID=271420 RepID=UPI000E9B8118|nr:SDR family oxidoreductase [Stutzerimonas xanthomarina]MBU0812915.1 SDR family oxidoreductase [Gammaproteobacteria bacterium]HAW23125.1 short-chain dehydrogenase [Pseudomonas sp.]MBK3847297.1 SDR family oxidoreductase [Stutzerimonas xanthomarina]MBU0854102.1 SDR family oxidoreductase [Gammaproteobacteria bacterium]MBU1302578.1 SDR family oxidoreductase [Gammaproteobacteria bacterium]|tara:strand:+ start:9348 stop:10028 length:681 start_codon:yes stop_codon:yes gene_type:complete